MRGSLSTSRTTSPALVLIASTEMPGLAFKNISNCPSSSTGKKSMPTLPARLMQRASTPKVRITNAVLNLKISFKSRS